MKSTPFIFLLLVHFAFNTAKAVTASFNYSVSGYTLTFNNNSTDATNYQWDFGDGSLSSDIAPVHTFSSSSDSYQIQLIAFNGSASDTASMYVSFVCTALYIDIDVFGDTVLCANENEVLLAPWGYFTYQWYKDFVAIPDAIDYTYNVTESGVYRCLMYTEGGCGAVSNLLTFTEVPAVDYNIVSSSPILEEGASVSMVVINNHPEYTYQYLWSGGQTTQSISVTETGLYSVEVSVDGHCPTTLSYYVAGPITTTPMDSNSTIILNTGINEMLTTAYYSNETNSITITDLEENNIVNSTFAIFNQNIIPIKNKGHFVLYTLQGQQLQNIEVQHNENISFTLTPGMYLIKEVGVKKMYKLLI